jgi:DNA-binding transcriptional MerR regulator
MPMTVGMTMTIDELAEMAGTTSRNIRSFQTLGLIEPPELRGRTGLYGPTHLDRVRAVLRLQAQGFSLQSLVILFEAQDRGRSLDSVLGLHEGAVAAQTVEAAAVVPAVAAGEDGPEGDSAELYGFADLLARPSARRTAARSRPLLAVVPTTLWDRTEAS